MQLTLWHLYYWKNRIPFCEVKNNFPLSEAEFPLCTLQNTYRTVQYIISKHIIMYSEDIARKLYSTFTSRKSLLEECKNILSLLTPQSTPWKDAMLCVKNNPLQIGHNKKIPRSEQNAWKPGFITISLQQRNAMDLHSICRIQLSIYFCSTSEIKITLILNAPT